MNQREGEINKLLLDNRFVDWVVNPQSAYAEYWLQWIGYCAENASLAEEAKAFLLELRKAEMSGHHEANKGQTELMWECIQDSIEAAPAAGPPKRVQGHRWYWVAAAAAIAGLVLFSGIQFLKQPEGRLPSARIIKETGFSTEVARYNGSKKNELVFLPDGSKITLAEGARISYSRLMNGEKREVFLTGEAFFNVSENRQKPFYIYTQNMVVKVLGTSFRVKAFTDNESVIVKTGKVSVYMKGQDLEQSAATILLPKQVCTYSSPKNELIASVYDNTSKIEMDTDHMKGYDFEDAPLAHVLKTLEKMYALPVHYDQRAFENCFITISLGDESLENKLEVIAKTVDASFSISDDGINIEGKGCK